MPYGELAHQLQDVLGISYPPVALAYLREAPSDVSGVAKAAPSACTFWRRAETDVFYAAGEDHYGCPIGLMTQGFDLPQSKMDELMELVGKMCEVAYLEESEVPHIPKVDKSPKGILYGPLARFPIEPDVVLVWATPAQAMILQETLGAATWAEAPAGSVFGRPACTALPVALASGRPALSLGCAGMRTFTEIPEDRCLVVVPQQALGTFAPKLEKTQKANEVMRGLYLSMKG